MEDHTKWWTGLWNCKNCGDVRMSGDFIKTWLLRSIPRVQHWVPACPECGHEDMMAIDAEYKNFCCWKCSRRMEVRNEKLVVTWQPKPMQVNVTTKEKMYVVSTQN